MKLLTYNFLTSKCIRGVKIGYPLKLNVSCNHRNYCVLCDHFAKSDIFSSLQIVNQQAVQMDFNPEFMTRIIPRLDWAAIYAGAEQVSIDFHYIRACHWLVCRILTHDVVLIHRLAAETIYPPSLANNCSRITISCKNFITSCSKLILSKEA